MKREFQRFSADFRNLIINCISRTLFRDGFFFFWVFSFPRDINIRALIAAYRAHCNGRPSEPEWFSAPSPGNLSLRTNWRQIPVPAADSLPIVCVLTHVIDERENLGFQYWREGKGEHE